MQLQAKQVGYLDEHLIGNWLVAIAPANGGQPDRPFCNKKNLTYLLY
ncbi:hypothetical protein QUB25_14835 [Microcoleus sp. B3-D7]